MSVLIDQRNLVIGNGDLFLAPNVGALPTLSAYKNALAGGGLPGLSGNVGAIKGTVSLELQREILPFELGLPLQVGAQNVIREGVHLKCTLAELSLDNIRQQLGLASTDVNYTEQTSGATLVAGEVVTLYVDTVSGYSYGSPLKMAPVLFTSSTPAASANPEVLSGTSTTSTDTGGTDLDAADGAVGNVVNAAAAGIVSGCTILIGTEQIVVGTVTSNSFVLTTRGANGTSAAAHAAGSAVSVLYANFTDYTINPMTNTISATHGGLLFTNGIQVQVSYYYNQVTSETLTGGGQNQVVNVALAFFHPYSDGRASMFTMRQASPMNAVTVPYEEIAYSHTPFELRGIADFTQAAGSQLWSFVREKWAA